MKFLKKVREKVSDATAKAALVKKAMSFNEQSSIVELVDFLEAAAPTLLNEGIELRVHHNQQTEDGEKWDAIVLVRDLRPKKEAKPNA